MTNVARLEGYIKTSSDLAVANNPLQSRVEVILTDFEPNLNKQGVPITEKARLMQSALNMPLKIHFDGDEFHGHSGAIPLGPIIRVWEDTYNGRAVIKGEAVIWTEHYKDIVDTIKSLFDIGVGTSWEIYYADSEVDENGVEWLHDIVYAGTCIVDTPAYGPERTRILAIAEKLGESMAKNLEETPTDQTEDTPNDIVEEVLTDQSNAEDNAPADNAAVAEDESVREEISEAQNLLFKIWEGLDQLYATTYELERQQTEANIGTIAENFAGLIAKIAAKIADMRSSVSSLSEEVTTLKTAEAERQAEKAKAELINTRREKLAESGVIFSEERWEERKETIFSMSDTAFAVYQNDMASLVVRSNKGQAEISNPAIPEPMHGADTIDIVELGKALKKALKG